MNSSNDQVVEMSKNLHKAFNAITSKFYTPKAHALSAAGLLSLLKIQDGISDYLPKCNKRLKPGHY